MAVIGLSKPHYAVYANTSGTVSYANGGVLGKAVEVNLEIETSEDNNLYGFLNGFRCLIQRLTRLL